MPMRCTYSGCESPATFHFARIQNRQCASEEHLCEAHARVAANSYGEAHLPFSGKRNVLEHARQFEISSVIISEINDQQVVYLHEIDGSRVFPILIGIFEATSLDRRLKGYTSPRPLTHDAWAANIRLFGGDVQDVVVDRLENRIYYTNARIRHQGRLLLLDIRPSDAFVLAVLCDCPIFITDQVLNLIDRQGSIK